MRIDTLIIQKMGLTPYKKAQEYGIILYHAGFERILLDEILEKFKNEELKLLDDSNIFNIIKQH